MRVLKSNKKFSQNLELLGSTIKDKTKIRTLSTNLSSKPQQIKLIVNDIVKDILKNGLKVAYLSYEHLKTYIK